MPSSLPNNILKLTVALLKHQAELWLGEEAVGIAGETLVEIGGEELQEKIDKFIAGEEGARELLAAAQRADDYFQKKCQDATLKGVFTLSFGDLPAVQKALEKLPKAMDLSEVQDELKKALKFDPPKLTQKQIEIGAQLYSDSLLRALSPLKDYTLPVIRQVVFDIQQKVNELGIDHSEIKSTLERIEKQISGHVAPQKEIKAFSGALPNEACREELATMIELGDNLFQDGQRSNVAKHKQRKSEWWNEVRTWAKNTGEFIYQNYGIIGKIKFYDMTNREMKKYTGDEGHDNRLSVLDRHLFNARQILDGSHQYIRKTVELENHSAQQENIDTQDKKRNRDIENLIVFFSNVNIQSLYEHTIETPTYRRFHVLLYSDIFYELVSNPLFRFYDKKLEKLIFGIQRLLKESLDHDEYYYPNYDDTIFIFGNPNHEPPEKRIRIMEAISKSANELRQLIDELLEYIRNYYLEIDLNELSARAWKLYVDFEKKLNDERK